MKTDCPESSFAGWAGFISSCSGFKCDFSVMFLRVRKQT